MKEPLDQYKRSIDRACNVPRVLRPRLTDREKRRIEMEFIAKLRRLCPMKPSVIINACCVGIFGWFLIGGIIWLLLP